MQGEVSGRRGAFFVMTAGICRQGEEMDRFVYIHGLGSGASSRSGRELAGLLGTDVICPEYDYARPFSECLSSLRRQIIESVDERNDRLCVMGSSLGGFYALQLRHPAIVHVVAWNPVIFPAMQLEQFLGMNTRFFDGTPWEFTRETLLSYAQAPDPRPWRNEMWAREERRAKDREEAAGPCFIVGGRRVSLRAEEEAKGSFALREQTVLPRRDIFLGDSDDILDGRLARAFWQGCAHLHDIVSGHQILDYTHAVDILKDGKMLENFSLWTAGETWAEPFREAAAFSLAGLFDPGDALERVRRMLLLADVEYLEMEGEKDNAAHTVLAVFFHLRHEARMKRLLAGLVRLCGGKSYALIRADGQVLRHQLAAQRLMDAEYRLPQTGFSFTDALKSAFLGWRGTCVRWQGHQNHGSLMNAALRERFADLWDRNEDPVEAFECD